MSGILGAAASAMAYQSTVVDVVGNNISNSGTHGFKKSRAVSEGAPQSGISPDTSRMGVAETTTDMIFDVGESLRTDDPMTFAINDENAFLPVTDFDGQVVFTRSGNLQMDLSGNVLASRGRQLAPPVKMPEGSQRPQVDENGAVSAENADGLREVHGQIQLSRFVNPQGLIPIGEGLFRESANSGIRADGTPGTEGFAPIAPGVVEASNVDLAEEFTNLLMAQRAYQASAKTFSVGDEMLATATNLTR